MNFQERINQPLDEIYFQNLCIERLRTITVDWYKNDKKRLKEENFAEKVSSGLSKVKDFLIDTFDLEEEKSVQARYIDKSIKNQNIPYQDIGEVTRFCDMPEFEQIVDDLMDIYKKRRGFFNQKLNSFSKNILISSGDLFEFGVFKKNDVEQTVMYYQSPRHDVSYVHLDLDHIAEVDIQHISKINEMDGLMKSYFASKLNAEEMVFDEKVFKNTVYQTFDNACTLMLKNEDLCLDSIDLCFQKFMEAYQECPTLRAKELLFMSIPDIKEQEESQAERNLSLCIEKLDKELLKLPVLMVQQNDEYSNISKQTKARKMKP